MSKKAMKIAPILQSQNLHPQSDQKYEMLRKNIGNSKQKPIKTELSRVSHVSRRLQSLSPQQAELIVIFNLTKKNTACIPVNCGLKVTSNEQKFHQAIEQRYVAIDMCEKQGSKPISPNTFEQLPKNKKYQVVYEYDHPYIEGNVQSSKDPQDIINGITAYGKRQNYLFSNEYRTTGYSTYMVATNDNVRLGGPAFFQTQGRMKYNQISTKFGNSNSNLFDENSKKRISSSQIDIIGCRTKSNTKDTFEEKESNIGINSKHNLKHIGSTQQYSDVRKERGLGGMDKNGKRWYKIEIGESLDMENERSKEFVQNIESRIIIGGNAEETYQGEMQINTPKQNSQSQLHLRLSLNTPHELNPTAFPSPELDKRKNKISEYQKKSAEEPSNKRKKSMYKYNLYSMLDEQFNLKCANGLCVPNQICASSFKREGWK